jgi:hypothetical protein
MRKIVLAALTTLGLLASLPSAHAAVCADGVYRAGCAGPNGAAVVRKPAPYPRAYYHGRYYRPPSVACASGPYRAGCAGPNGAAVVRRPY